MSLCKIWHLLFIQKTNKTIIQLFRYTFVGGLAFLLDITILITLTEFAGIHYLASAAIGFTIGLITNYILSVIWVFDKRRVQNKRLEFTIFLCIGLTGLIFNEFLIWFFTEEATLHYTSSKIVATIIIYFWNFLVRKLTLFR